MTLVYVPFCEREMFDGDCLMSGEFVVDVASAAIVRDKTAKHYLDKTADYSEFVDEYDTTVDGVWAIEESIHTNIMNSMPDCGKDSAVYAAIRTMKNMIANMAVDTIYYAKAK